MKITDKQYKTFESIIYLLCGVILPIALVIYAIIS